MQRKRRGIFPILALLTDAAQFLLVGLLRLYQRTLGAVLPNSCRFRPTCSEYFIQAVQKFGPLKGTALGVWRFLRCNPYCKGGHDPVP